MKATKKVLPIVPTKTPFRLVSELIKPDSKKRISLGAALSGQEKAAAAYNIYVNTIGQIVLDPVRVIPEAEVWLLKNKAAGRSVKTGLADAADSVTKNHSGQGAVCRCTKRTKKTKASKANSQ